MTFGLKIWHRVTSMYYKPYVKRIEYKNDRSSRNFIQKKGHFSQISLTAVIFVKKWPLKLNFDKTNHFFETFSPIQAKSTHK